MLCNYTYSRGVKKGSVCGKCIRNPDNIGKCYEHSKRKTDMKREAIFRMYGEDGLKLEKEIEKLVSKAEEEYPDKKIRFVIDN